MVTSKFSLIKYTTYPKYQNNNNVKPTQYYDENAQSGHQSKGDKPWTVQPYTPTIYITLAKNH